MNPVDGGGFDLSIPRGDPDGLRRAAARLSEASARSAHLVARSRQAREESLHHWQGRAAAAFAEVADQVSARLRPVDEATAAVAATLRRFANALETAQAGLRALQRRWDAVVHEADVERRRLAAGGQPGPLEPWEILSRGQARLSREATALRTELATAARVAAADIASWAALGLPGGSAASAGDLARRSWEEGWQLWGSLPAKLLQKANGLRSALGAFGRLDLYAEWAGGLAQRVGTAERALAGELEALGETESLSALNAWMRFRQTASAADQLLTEAQPVAAFGDAGSPVMSVLGKVGLPLAIAGDVATIVKPGDEKGAHATATRVMAGANLAASGTLLAAGAGVLTLTPPGALVVGGVLVGTAAYAVGDLVYEHREEIGHALESAGGWVVDEVASAADDIADLAGDVAGGVADGVSDVKDTVVGWFS